MDYTYRVVYYDIPSGRWVELTERVRGDFSGNLLEVQHRTRVSDSSVSPNILPDNWPVIAYDRSVYVADVGISLVVFSGEHISSHNIAGTWTKYKLFLEGPGSGRSFLRWSGMRVDAMPWFLTARTSLASGLLFLATVQDINAASNGITSDLAVKLSLDASGWAEIVLQAMKFARIAGPLGVFTLGFTIGYEIGGLLGLGFVGRVALGVVVGAVFVLAVFATLPVLLFIIVAATVIVIVIIAMKYLGW